MSKPFAVFDIDGTIFRSSLLIEVVNALIAKGIFPATANNKIQPALELWHNRATPNAYTNYIKEVVAAFSTNIRGVTETQLSIVSKSVIENKSRQTYVYTRDLIRQLSATHDLLAISGSPHQLVELFAKEYGFKDFVATKYEVVDGVFTGKFVLAGEQKDITLAEIVKNHELNYQGSVAVGDTKGDIELLSAVETPIAFNPDGHLREVAQANGWKIVVERKDQIYTLNTKDGTYELA